MSRRPWFRSGAGIAIAVSIAGSSASALGAGDDARFVTVAEGLTSPTTRVGIHVAYRMFSVPDMPSVCAAAKKVTRLKAPTRCVELHVGRSFPISSLKAVAVDAAGVLIPKVPIAVEVEETWPPLLDLRSDHIANSRLTPLRPGRFRFRIRTFCGGTSAETTIDARIGRRRVGGGA